MLTKQSWFWLFAINSNPSRPLNVNASVVKDKNTPHLHLYSVFVHMKYKQKKIWNLWIKYYKYNKTTIENTFYTFVSTQTQMKFCWYLVIPYY